MPLDFASGPLTPLPGSVFLAPPHSLYLTRCEMLAERLEQGGFARPFDIAAWRTCAVGVACTMPEFQAQGLRFDGDRPIYTDPRTGAPYPEHMAAKLFFGLTEEKTSWFFAANRYDDDDKINALECARRLREHVAKGRAELAA